jgi:hypothetical protein
MASDRLGMPVDDIARGLRDVARYLSKNRGLSRLEAAVSNALLFMAVSRHVEVNSDRGDGFLIEQISAAARACDSSLLDFAAVRLQSLVRENQSLRQQVESLSERSSRLD